jgi:hypothetical protein
MNELPIRTNFKIIIYKVVENMDQHSAISASLLEEYSKYTLNSGEIYMMAPGMGST